MLVKRYILGLQQLFAVQRKTYRTAETATESVATVTTTSFRVMVDKKGKNKNKNFIYNKS